MNKLNTYDKMKVYKSGHILRCECVRKTKWRVLSHEEWEALKANRAKRVPISDKLKILVYKKTNGRCVGCGVKLVNQWECHHIKQVFQGGTNELDNLIGLCYRCHKVITHHYHRHCEILKRIIKRSPPILY